MTNPLRVCLPMLCLAMLYLANAAASLIAADDAKEPTAAAPRDPNLNPAHDQARTNADQAHQQGDYRKAIEIASGVLAQNPNDHVAYYLRASSRVELGVAQREAALVRQGITDSREAIRLKPMDNVNYFLPYLLGMTSLAGLENKPAHAEVAVTVASQLLEQPTLPGADRSNVLYQRAVAHAAMQATAKAIQDYQDAVTLTPRHLGARVGLADLLAAAGQHDAALVAYSEAVTAFPSMALVYNNRGTFQQAQGRFNEARSDFTKALELDPKFLVSLINRGFTLMNQGHFEEAEKDFTEALKIDAAQPAVLSMRAGSKLSRGDLEAAIKDYTDVLKWDSKNAIGHAELGIALFFARQTQPALAELDTASELNSQLRFVLPWRYLAMMQLGQRRQADTKFAAVIGLPANKREWGDTLLAYLADRLSEADLRKAINRQDPQAGDAQACEAEFFVGHRKLLAGQRDAADVHFRRALTSKSTHLSAYRGAKFALK